jgi:TM2 domain-containing membrane protein YozV
MNCAVHTNTPATAYCRTCGKALCEDCKREVMGAIYCEPCIAARLQGQPAPGASVPGVGMPPPLPPMGRVPGAPNPILAGLLGFIPGVGAMYNGQFTKAFAHVVIFILLIFVTDNVSGIFGVLIGFFVVYMAFEAYKTAEAKRMGMPAPDPLGLDKMLGIQESHVHIANPASQPTTASSAYPPVTAYSSVQPLQVEPPPPQARDNTPVGAIILIILGIVFFFDNLGYMHMHRLWPLFLIGIGLWIAYKRTTQRDVGGLR